MQTQETTIAHCMTAYMAWADDVTLCNAEQLPVTELMASRQTLFETISGTFDHILVVAEIFQAQLQGCNHPHRARYRDRILPFSEVAQRLRAIDAYYVDLASSWSDAELAEKVHFEFVGGGEGVMTRQDILLHLANHSTYHRGFISTLIYPLVSQSQPSDLTVFLRDSWVHSD